MAKFIRLTQFDKVELILRPESIMAFGAGRGFPQTSFIFIWGIPHQFWMQESPSEIAALLLPSNEESPKEPPNGQL